MSKNLDLFMRLNWSGGNVSTGLARTTREVGAFTRAAQTGFGKMADQMRRLNAELNGFSAITRMAGGYLGFQVAQATFKTNLDFHKNLLEMKQTGEMSRQQMAGAKKAIMQLSGQMLQSPQDMLEGLRAFTTAGEKYEFALAAVGESARTATAFFSRPVDIANMDVDLKQKMGLRAEDLKTAHNMLLYHARSGRYETKAMSMDAPRTLNTMAQAGITGIEGVNLMGALTQRLMRLAPTTQPAEVATYMEHFMGHLTQPHYVKGLAKAGIDIKKFMPGGKFGGVDSAGNAIGGQAAVNGFLALLEEMNAKGLKDPFKMGEAGFREMYTQKAAMQSLQDVGELRKALDAGTQGAKVDLVGAAFAEIREADFGKVKIAEVEIAKAQLGEAATGGTGVVASLSGWAAESKAAAALGAGGALIGGRLLWKHFRGGVGGGDLPGAPVRRDTLTNAVIGGGSTTPSRTAVALGGFKGALKFGAPLAVGMGAWNAYEISGDNDLSAGQKRDAYGRIAAGTAGGLVGAGIGGGIGALFGGFGALPGAMIGGAIGNVIGEKIAAWLQKEKSVTDGYTGPPIVLHNNINLSGEQIATAVNEFNARTSRRH